jgi:hypothetical protein
MGDYESRIYLQIQEQDKLTIQDQNNTNGGSMFCPDIYCSNDDNQLFQFLTMDTQSAKFMVLLTIENARNNHMFMFNKKTKSLHIYNVDMEKLEEEQEAFTFQQLQRERLITIIPNFDYNLRVKYHLDMSAIFYVWKGNLISRNILTGERKETKFAHKIMEGTY